MGKETAKVLALVPEYKGREEVIQQKQSARGITTEVLNAHEHFAADYDLLVASYPFLKSVSIEEQLFDFCRNNLHYNAETVEYQTTRSPAGIIELGKNESIGVDCKHYAGYIGGVLDAMNRKAGYVQWDWCYRFASYDNDPTPGHVFIVVFDDDGELWIDPVLDAIDKRYPSPYYILDKKIKFMPLVRLSGTDSRYKSEYSDYQGIGCADCDRKKIGQSTSAATATPTEISASQVQTQTTGQAKIETVGTALETVGAGLSATGVGVIAGGIVAAVGALVNVAGKVFGSTWTENNEVRWLIQMYQFYVLAQANVKTDNDVNESYLQAAYNWFFAVLGVPVYDANTVALLANTNSQGKKETQYSAAEAAARYLTYPQITKLAFNTTLQEATNAATIAISSLNFYGNLQETAAPVPGQWANLPVAQVWIDAASAQGVTAVDTNGNVIPASNFFSGVVSWVQANPWLALLIGGGVVGGIYLLTKKKSK